ncbi:MAG: 16S rRNA (cytidine(1402)-2'-O)-methyltransferase [Bacteroidota bacterium]
MGILYVVPTPIGNLEDITLRALSVLKSVDLILAEDTRTSKKLLNHFDISTPLASHHMHNEHSTVAGLVQRMKSGAAIALISDAGTPAISDPGFLLVRACIAEEVAVTCLPGATAFVPALVNSGLPNERFVFEGFLPPKKGRQTRLQQLSEETRTVVLYVSPHKLLKTLLQLEEHFGSDRPMAVSRELTKRYEEVRRGMISDMVTHFTNTTPKGEFVLVIGGKR